MFKAFFISRKPVDPVDIEFELAMQAINKRMEKMLGHETVSPSNYIPPERRAGAYQLR